MITIEDTLFQDFTEVRRLRYCSVYIYREVWRDVLDYEGYYQVSNRARVRSLPRTIVRSDGRRKTFKGRMLRPGSSGNSHYLTVVLSKNGKGKSHYLHTLVLEAFVGRRPPGKECRHFPDRDPHNNRLGNLSWGTRSEQDADKVIHGTDTHGERSATAKLTSTAAQQMRRMFRAGYTQTALSVIFRVSMGTVSRVVRYTSYKTSSRDEIAYKESEKAMLEDKIIRYRRDIEDLEKQLKLLG